MNGKLIIGGEKGRLRLWEVGIWDDNEETLMVGKGASADVLAKVPEGVGKEQMLAVGMDDGVVRFVGMGGKRPKVLPLEVSHEEVEGVLALGFDVGGRMCSGGGQVVKVWEESIANGAEDEEEDEEVEEMAVDGKRPNVFGSDDDQDDGEGASADDSSEEEKPKKRKKRKRNKGKGTGKAHGIMGFKGLD